MPCSSNNTLLQKIFGYDKDSPMQTIKKPTLELKEKVLKTLLQWMVASGKFSFQISFDFIIHCNFRSPI